MKETYIVSLNTNSLATPTLSQQQNVEFNCFTFGNGVEATRIKGGDTEPFLIYTPRASSSIEKYEQEELVSSLTYSGVFVENTNVNNLNEFNLSLANYKDLSREYGPIQKLHTRDNDLIALQEDKISKILFGKNLLSDSVGGGAVTSIPEVLGTQIPYVGEYGISHNPESFAQWGNSLYFADAKRGAVLRLGGDGLFEINNLGMSDYFKDLFRDNFTTQKLGVYDPFKEQYVISNTTQTAVPCESRVRALFKNDPVVSFAATTLQIDIQSTQSWTVQLIDTGDGTAWASINGATPTYTGSGNEVVTIEVSAQPLLNPQRQLNFTVTTCDGIALNQTLSQNGTTAIELGVWGVGTGVVDALILGNVTYTYTSNTAGDLEYLDIPFNPNSDLFLQKTLVGQESEIGIPYEGDTVTVKIAQAGAPNKSLFSPDLGGKMYYLATNTKYNESEVSNALADPGLTAFTPALVGLDYVGTFTFNRVGFEYFYIIVDYTNEIASGPASQFDIAAAENNVAGTFRGKINFGDREGNVSLPYIPSGVAGNIVTIKQENNIVATTGTVPVTVAGTLDFVKDQRQNNVYDVEVEYFGDNQPFRLTTPHPTLTSFDWRTPSESLDPSDPLYVCRLGAPAMNATRYHNGPAALPGPGDKIYEDPNGLVVLGNPGIYRYGTAVPPNSTYLQLGEDGVVAYSKVCAACTEVASPVINMPINWYFFVGQEVYLNIANGSTLNAFFWDLQSSCETHLFDGGAEGGSADYTECGTGATRVITLKPNETLAVAATGFVATSGTITASVQGPSFPAELPPGLKMDREKGIISGVPTSVGVFQTLIYAENCFGRGAAEPFDFWIIDRNTRVFQMDGDQFAYDSTGACGITPNATTFFYNGPNDDPLVGDTVLVPTTGKDGTADALPFKGGYNWYKQVGISTAPATNRALLIDDKGVIVDIFTCP